MTTASAAPRRRTTKQASGPASGGAVPAPPAKRTKAKAQDGAAALRERAEAMLSKASIELLQREPFFGHLMIGLARHLTEAIPTMAVALRGEAVELLVNPRFVVEELARGTLCAGVLKHEVLHVVFRHLFRMDAGTDRRLWNVAADLVVNQFVAPFALPEGALTLKMFREFSLEPDDTVDAYYAALRAVQQAGGGLAARLEALLEGGSGTDHDHWAGSPGGVVDEVPTGQGARGEMPVGALEHAFDALIERAHAKSERSRPGTTPAWLSRVLEALRARRQPQVDWRRQLRLFVQSGYRTRIVTTTRRESRRFEAVPGARRPAGLKVRRLLNLCVAIDTSGSISAGTLARFMEEVHGIHRQGATITVVECDAAVTRVWPYKGKPGGPPKGGGGTAFEPVIAWLREGGRRVDAAIYLTDARGPAPVSRAPCPLLWVVHGDADASHLPGRAIRIR